MDKAKNKNENSIIRIVIIEDNKFTRNGWEAVIQSNKNFNLIGSFADCESAFTNDIWTKIDLVLMDIGLPGMNGIEGVKNAVVKDRDLSILMLTVYEESEFVFDALCAGACGYLVKKTPPARLLEAIRDANDGGSPMSSRIARQVITAFKEGKNVSLEEKDFDLTEREVSVLNLLAEGYNYQEIAETLYISVDTVRHHIRNIYKKLHVHSQSEAVAKAIRKKII